MTLAQLQTGQSGRITRVLGGRGLAAHLSAMGIRPGRKVTKISSMLMRGPVTIQVDSSQIAIGFGMAHKIIVEPEPGKE